MANWKVTFVPGTVPTGAEVRMVRDQPTEAFARTTGLAIAMNDPRQSAIGTPDILRCEELPS